MTISPGFAGFIKGVLGVIVLALVGYLTDASHLTGILSPALAVVAAGIFSGIESSLKNQSGGTTALFGAVKIS